MNKRSQLLQSKKVLERRRKKRIVTYSLFSVAGISVIVAFVFLVNLSFFQISKISFTGIESLDPKELQGSVETALSGSSLSIFSKKSTFFVSKFAVEEVLLKNFKKIETLQVSRDGFTGLMIDVVERKPVVLVCSGFHEVNTEEVDESCYFTDEKGYVFAPAPEFSAGVYMRYYLSALDGEDLVGKDFIELEKFQSLQNFVGSLSTRGIAVRGLLLADGGMYELYIKNTDQSEAIIYFDDRSPFERTASNLIAFWDNSRTAKASKKNTTSSLPIFEYINLRFGNNIFYVLK